MEPNRPAEKPPVPRPVKRAQSLLANHVSTWRKLRGLTQAQLAERAGVDRKVVIRLEAADGGVGIESLMRVLRGLGILDALTVALDPHESDLGRMRGDEHLPIRVRHARRSDV